MTSTLIFEHPSRRRPVRQGADSAARDWAEIQERMLVPLYDAVYDRLELGAGSRLLGVGCGCGLALLMAADRGAAVTGVERDEQRLALAHERLLPEQRWGGASSPRATGARLLCGGPSAAAPVAEAFNAVTVFDPAGADTLASAARLAERGSPVVLTGWGPPERCATARVLDTVGRLAGPGGPAPVSARDDLEDWARAAGLRPDGSGRVACPFAYPDMDSAVRGLRSTGLLDPAVASAGHDRVGKELAEAMHPFRRPDGSVRMDNVFRYLIARVTAAATPRRSARSVRGRARRR